MLEADGLDAYDAMIAAVQAQFPGLVMRRTSPLDGHRDLVRFHWALGEPGADPAFAGIDVAKYDGDGKLHRIIGFVPEAIPAALMSVGHGAVGRVAAGGTRVAA